MLYAYVARPNCRYFPNDSLPSGKPKPPIDPRVSAVNHFLRRHKFFTRSSFATFTSSKRRTFERDVCFFAKTLNLSEKVAREELSKARIFCREDVSDSEDSAWLNEIDDSSHVSGSRDSRATSPATLKFNEATLDPRQFLPNRGESQIGKQFRSLGDKNTNPHLLTMLLGSQHSSQSEKSKKRKRAQGDTDKHEAKQINMKRARTRPAKKSSLEVSTSGDRDHVISPTQASTSSQKPNSATENEVPKTRNKRKRRKKGAKAHQPGEAADLNDHKAPKRIEGSSDNILALGPEKAADINPQKRKEPIKPGSDISSNIPAASNNEEESNHISQDPRTDGAQQPPGMDQLFKLQRKEAKKARRRATRKASVVNEDCKANVSESKSSPHKNNLQEVNISQTEQDPHPPRDFHSPMIQSV